jgi:hypothetical protein
MMRQLMIAAAAAAVLSLSPTVFAQQGEGHARQGCRRREGGRGARYVQQGRGWLQGPRPGGKGRTRRRHASMSYRGLWTLAWYIAVGTAQGPRLLAGATPGPS